MNDLFSGEKVMQSDQPLLLVFGEAIFCESSGTGEIAAAKNSRELKF